MIVLNSAGKRLHEYDGELAGSNLSGRKLNSGVFDGLNLEGVDLSGSQLISASFNETSALNSKLAGANLQGAHLMDACFDGADLSNADLYWCIAQGASF